MKEAVGKDIKSACGNCAEIRSRGNCQGMILGYTDSSGKHCIDYNPALTDIRADENLFITGEGGAAESCDAAIPYCRQAIRRGHSIVITDIRNELYRGMSEEFRNAGYIVKRLDFNDAESSDSWDLLGSLRGMDFVKNDARAVSEVLRLSGDLLSQIDLSVSKVAVAAVEYFMLCLYIRKLFTDSSVKEEDKNVKTLMERIEHLECEELCMFDERVMMNARELLRDHLSALTDSRIVKMVSGRGIDTFLPNVGKCAYFVSLPVSAKNDGMRLQPLVAAFINSIVCSPEITGKPRRVQVDFLLRDLGFWKCRIPRLESALLSAKYKKMSFCLIDRFDNLKKLYFGKAYDVLRRCSIWQVFGDRIPGDMLDFLDGLGKADEFFEVFKCNRQDSETVLVSVCGNKPVLLYKNKEYVINFN